MGFAQPVKAPVSSAYIHFGSYSNRHIDVFSFQNNQACLASVKNFSVGVYGEQRFLLRELSLYHAAAALPTHSGNFGLSGSYFGNADYAESQLGLAYARKWGDKVDVGIQFNYYMLKVSSYGNASAINFEAGAVFHLTEKINGGIHVYNPVGGKLNKGENEKLPAMYSAGLGFEPSDKFFISAEIEKEEDKPLNVKVGMQYRFVDQFHARAGISSSSSAFYFGIGYKWKAMRLDVTASYHQQLGFTPGLVLIFENPKNKE